MKQFSAKKGALWFIISVAIGVAAAVFVFLLLSAAASALILKSNIPHRLIIPIAAVMICIGALVGSFVAGKLYHRRALIVGIVFAAALFVLLCLSGIISGEHAYGVPILAKAFCSLVPSAIGAVIGANIRSRA